MNPDVDGAVRSVEDFNYAARDFIEAIGNVVDRDLLQLKKFAVTEPALQTAARGTSTCVALILHKC